MSPRQLRSALAKIEAHKVVIAARRDAIRAIIAEIEAVDDSLTRGVASLEEGIEALSELL